MQTVLDVPTTTHISPVSLADAQRAASAYVATCLEPAFEVVEGTRYYHKLLGKEIWQFIVRCVDGPLDAIAVDVQTGAVIPLVDAKRRVIREKAVLYTARKRNVLPVDAQGYVLSEYARRQASQYLAEHLSMFYEGADPIFVPGEPPVWQVTIVFKMYAIGPITLGVLDVDAKAGEPLPLVLEQIECIQERARAIVRYLTSTTTTG